jgi:hypothetical protein
VAAELGGVDGDHDLVAGAGRDLMIAARAAVVLHCLIGLDVAHLDRSSEVERGSGGTSSGAGHQGPG